MKNFPKLTRQILAVTLLCSLSSYAFSADWQADREAWVSGWRTGKVVQVDKLSGTIASATDGCTTGPATSKAGQQRLTLRYKQNRRAHQYQVIAPADEAVQVGDVLRFNLKECTTERLNPAAG